MGQNLMAEKLDPKELVTFNELLMSNTYEQEALVIPSDLGSLFYTGETILAKIYLSLDKLSLEGNL
jgi:hypothetical protein